MIAAVILLTTAGAINECYGYDVPSRYLLLSTGDYSLR